MATREQLSILEEIKEGGLDWIYDSQELPDWTKDTKISNSKRKEADIYEY